MYILIVSGLDLYVCFIFTRIQVLQFKQNFTSGHQTILPFFLKFGCCTVHSFWLHFPSQKFVTSLFKVLNLQTDPECVHLCLEAIRILTREKTRMFLLEEPEGVNVLLRLAGFTNGCYEINPESDYFWIYFHFPLFSFGYWKISILSVNFHPSTILCYCKSQFISCLWE